MDTLTVRGLRTYAYHGVREEERFHGQPFVLDLVLFVDLSRPGATDALEDTVDYAAASRCALAVFTAQADDLIERAATRVAAALLETFPLLHGVTVRVHKPRAPLAADFDTVTAEITRTREEAPQ